MGYACELVERTDTRGVLGSGSPPERIYALAEHLTHVFQDEPLAQYRVTYQPATRRLKTVTEERLFDTPHRSPQPPLWAWGADEWLRVLRLPAYAPRRPRTTDAFQERLFS